jgi:hypothetical protein
MKNEIESAYHCITLHSLNQHHTDRSAFKLVSRGTNSAAEEGRSAREII